jgi:Domain of unknown function (DUF4407)
MTMAKGSPAPEPQDVTGVIQGVGWWQRLLWCIGGFYSGTLVQAQCRAVRSKYSSMGALVLLTALLASCSGGYAVFTIFNDVLATVMIGALWGCMILTLDRFLVSTSRKMANARDFNVKPNALPPYASRTSWLTLAIRLPLAVMIGIVVAAPIETRLMRSLVDEYENSRTESRRQTSEADATLVKLEGDLGELRSEYKTRAEEVVRAQGIVVRAQKTVEEEAAGTGGTHQRGTKKQWRQDVDAWKQDVDAYNKTQGALEKVANQVTIKEAEVRSQRNRLSAAISRDFEGRHGDRSFIREFAILREIAIGRGARSMTVRIVSAFLTFFFVLIECIPILAKAISPFDPYDATLQEFEHGSILDSLVEARRRYAEASLSE